MYIGLKKFGTILTSRQAGKEALAAFTPTLNALALGENIIIDFEGVDVLSPSWADEFITPLQNNATYRVTLKNTDNASVKATLEMLEEIHKFTFNATS